MKQNIAKAQEQMKNYFDKKHKEVSHELDVGKLVWRRVSQQQMPGTSRKLQLAWTGPYKIIAAPTTLNRVIEHVNRKEQSVVVHVEQLKPYRDENLELAEDAEEDEHLVEEILQERVRNGKKEYLIRWAGYTKKFDTWEPAENVHADEILQRWNQRSALHRQAPLPDQRRSAMDAKGREGKGKGEKQKESISPKELKTKAQTTKSRTVTTPARFRD
jgi:hypothetical protein